MSDITVTYNGMKVYVWAHVAERLNLKAWQEISAEQLRRVQELQGEGKR